MSKKGERVVVDALTFTGSGENENLVSRAEGGRELWQRVVEGLHPDEDNSGDLEKEVLRLIHLAPVVGDSPMDLYTRLESEIISRSKKKYISTAEALHELLDEYRL